MAESEIRLQVNSEYYYELVATHAALDQGVSRDIAGHPRNACRRSSSVKHVLYTICKACTRRLHTVEDFRSTTLLRRS